MPLDELINHFALPNIIVTRYEANKKTGFVGIDENGTVNLLNAVKNKITSLTIEGGGGMIGSYTIDGYNGNNYDIIVPPGMSYLDFINFQEGQEVVCIVNNSDPLGGPALLVISASEVIKWLNNDLPSLDTNAKIIFYKSNNIIYAEIKKPYVGGAGSDSGS